MYLQTLYRAYSHGGPPLQPATEEDDNENVPRRTTYLVLDSFCEGASRVGAKPMPRSARHVDSSQWHEPMKFRAWAMMVTAIACGEDFASEGRICTLHAIARRPEKR